MTRSETLAYIAGIVDNQGSIFIRQYKVNNSRNYSLSMAIYHKEKSILEFVQDFFQAGKIYRDRQGYQIKLGASDTDKILRELLPYLILRKEEAELAIKFQQAKKYDSRPLSDEERQFRRSCYEEMKRLKKR